MDFTPPPPSPLSKSGLKLVCKVNIVYGNLRSDNFQDYAQKPQRNCTFMNSASVPKTHKTYMLIPTALDYGYGKRWICFCWKASSICVENIGPILMEL